MTCGTLVHFSEASSGRGGTNRSNRDWDANAGVPGMSESLDVGVLGVGNIGTVHLQTALSDSGVGTVTAADALEVNRNRAARLGADRTYGDYADLLADAEPDVAIIALPPFLHADATLAAAEHGAHAFVEKPFARDPSEAAEMVDAADRAGVRLGVDHTIRYQPEIRRIKEQYDEGTIGHVPTSSIWRINNGPFTPPPADGAAADWQLDPSATGGGALMDLGVHLFDVLEWFFGELSVEHATFDRTLDLPYEDAATVVVSSEAGTTATLTCGFFQWESPPEVTGGMRLDGVADSLSSEEFVPDHFTGYAARAALENLTRRLGGETPEYFKPTYYYQAHYHALTDFLDAVREDREPPVTGADGARMVELVAEAYDLAERAEPTVEVPNV